MIKTKTYQHMHPTYKRPASKDGFSLIELSIVLIIIGVLVSISLTLGNGQISGDNIKSTQAKLDKIDQAMAAYLKTNNSLPCPGDGTASSSQIGIAGVLNNPSDTLVVTANSGDRTLLTTATPNGLVDGERVYLTGLCYNSDLFYTVKTASATTFRGMERVDGGAVYQTIFGAGGAPACSGTVKFGMSDASCPVGGGGTAGYNLPSGSPNYYVGIVPVRTLGLSDDYAFDAWGNRITYAVSKNCIDPDNWDATYINKCTGSTGSLTGDGANITVNDLSGVAKVTDAAYVVMSLGKNGYGAWNRAGTKIAASINTKETNNSSATYSSAVFNEGIINDGLISSNYFDDIVHFKTAAKIWNDAYAAPAMPSCLTTQLLVSNGGNSYGCYYNLNFQYTLYGVSFPYFIQAAPPGLPTPPIITVPMSSYPQAKYVWMVNSCSASSGGNIGYTTFQLDLLDGTSLGPYYGCWTFNNTTTGRLDMGNNLIMPLPDTTVDIKLGASSVNVTGTTQILLYFLY